MDVNIDGGVALGEPGWDSLDPHAGEVVEVFLPDTDWEDAPQEWAGFLVMQVSMDVGSGALVLEAKSLGCNDGEMNKALGNMFNRRRGLIHLCTSKPCVTGNSYDIHATRVRITMLDDFEADYITRSTRAQIKKWRAGGAEEPELEAKIPVRPRMRVHGKGHDGLGKKRPGALKASAKQKAGSTRSVPLKSKAGDGEDPPAASVDALKAKLASLKARMSGTATSGAADTEAGAEDGVLEVESSEEDFTAPWEREKPLETGTELIPFHVGKSGDKSKRKMKRKKASLEASSGSTMRGLQSQLATRAVAASERTKGPRKSKRSSAEKVGEAIVKALNIGKVKKEKKEKKSKKERKRKKKRSRPGGDPSSAGESESSEENSEDSSSEKSQGSSEDYENPMRRKSIKRPGSVLELLVQHARDQLEQSSTVGIPQGKMRIDEGVRVLSYFQILLRPQLGPVTGPVREMFLIASVLWIS